MTPATSSDGRPPRTARTQANGHDATHDTEAPAQVPRFNGHRAAVRYERDPSASSQAVSGEVVRDCISDRATHIEVAAIDAFVATFVRSARSCPDANVGDRSLPRGPRRIRCRLASPAADATDTLGHPGWYR